MTKPSCRDCKHLETDGMFGIFCGVGGDNTKYDCPKYEQKREDRMTAKRFIIIGDSNIEFIMQTQLLLPIYDNKERLSLKSCCDLLNGLYEENQDLKSFNKDLAENLSACTNARISKDNWIEKLTEENEQLKQAYNDAKKDVEKKEQILKDIMNDNLMIQDIEKELEE